jgi:hypothetical protein
MVYKNKGVVKNGCCVVESAPPPPPVVCVPPTAGNITITDLGPTGNPTYDTLYSYAVNQTNGTSFVWFYGFGDNGFLQLSDSDNISGSQTPILLIKTKTTDCSSFPPSNFYCVVSNNCGSARSEDVIVQGCGF